MGVRPTWARTLTPVIAAKAALTRRNLSSVSRKARPTGLLTTRSSTSARRRHPLAASTPRRTAASHLVTTPPDARLTARTPLPLRRRLVGCSRRWSARRFRAPPTDRICHTTFRGRPPGREAADATRGAALGAHATFPLAFARAVVWTGPTDRLDVPDAEGAARRRGHESRG